MDFLEVKTEARRWTTKTPFIGLACLSKNKKKEPPDPVRITCAVIALLVFGLLFRNWRISRLQGSGTGCKSNLKNVAAALEMYSSDNGGEFPKDLSALTPQYLKAIPTCPPAGTATYVSGYRSEGSSYQLYCAGANHLPIHIPANYPQYSNASGLVERP